MSNCLSIVVVSPKTWLLDVWNPRLSTPEETFLPLRSIEKSTSKPSCVLVPDASAIAPNMLICGYEASDYKAFSPLPSLLLPLSSNITTTGSCAAFKTCSTISKPAN